MIWLHTCRYYQHSSNSWLEVAPWNWHKRRKLGKAKFWLTRPAFSMCLSQLWTLGRVRVCKSKEWTLSVKEVGQHLKSNVLNSKFTTLTTCTLLFKLPSCESWYRTLTGRVASSVTTFQHCHLEFFLGQLAYKVSANAFLLWTCGSYQYWCSGTVTNVQLLAIKNDTIHRCSRYSNCLLLKIVVKLVRPWWTHLF